MGALLMSFGTQGQAFYLIPQKLRVSFSKRERDLLRNTRMAWSDPILAEKFITKAKLASIKRVSNKKKANISLAPIGWGK